MQCAKIPPYRRKPDRRSFPIAKVIVVSEDLGRLSSVVLALAALTRPLLWVHPLVPVLPVGMGEMIFAPVPYIIGERRVHTQSTFELADGGLSSHPTGQGWKVLDQAFLSS